MRVAAVYDIHGNIDALNAVLSEIESLAVDLIVIGGDIAWGAFPREAVERVMYLGERARVIRGNADREIVSPPETADAPGWVEEVNHWCLQQLTASQQTFLSQLPLTEVIRIEAQEVLFCHASPRSDDEIFTAATPENELVSILGQVVQDLVVCGHTHTQFERQAGPRRIVNAGSVGMPYEDHPGAYWAVVEKDVQLMHTTYDFASAAESIRRSTCPHKGTFADAVVSPVSRDIATQGFEASRRNLKR